ncbi:MAG: purine-nucleoside phosphorylase [Chloroflexi bacterium]|nr:purine-nucleoside phosphorylase [Chloroflexota bacterium]
MGTALPVALHETVTEAVRAIRSRTAHRPEVVVVTGSGLAGLAAVAADADRIPYAEIPGFPISTVGGHPGEFVLGRLAGRTVAIQHGRVHFYEGYSLAEVTLPIRVLRALGATTLVVTNAAGGINPVFRVGDLMLIADHIGLPSLAGFNPLVGPNDAALGPRIPMMVGAYDERLREKVRWVAAELGIPLQEGVYAWVSGPTFETPAEVRFLRAVGADAVGMSTVPEVIVARHAGMAVLGFSVITNVAHDAPPAGDVAAEVHEGVLTAGKTAVPRLAALIEGVLG